MKQREQFEIADKLTSYVISYTEKHELLKARHNWQDGKDVRLTIFSKTINTIQFARTGLYIGRKKYFYRTAHRMFRSPLVDSKQIRNMVLQEYLQGIKRGFFLQLFMAFESSIRTIAEALACNYPKDLTATCHGVLKQTDTLQYEPLLEILRLTRNSIHNNGIYSGNLRTPITYRGKPYNFTANTPVTMEWDNIDDWLYGLLELYDKVVTHSDVVNKNPAQMTDPAA